MRFLKNYSIRFYLGFFVILALAIGGSVAAFADSPSTQVAVTGAANVTETGPFSVSATPVILNGTNLTTTYTMDILVADDTGTGAGWHLTITSTVFNTGNDCTSKPNNILPFSASTVTGVVMAENGTGTYTDPTPSGTVTYPSTLPAGCPAPTAVSLYSAKAGTGLGHFKITPTVSISIPANTYAGTYTSTVTLGIATGP